jgi:hypothetical protein
VPRKRALKDVKSPFSYRLCGNHLSFIGYVGKIRFPGKNSNLQEQIERETNLIVAHATIFGENGSFRTSTFSVCAKLGKPQKSHIFLHLEKLKLQQILCGVQF